MTFDLPKFGDGVCLARLAALLAALDIDRARLQSHSIAVTGSNGKGSTAAFCESIGRACGLRTGLFTSPHLFSFNERFRIDGVPVADAALDAAMTRVAAAIAAITRRRGEKFGGFEAQFATACLLFQEAACDLTVFEAGIGGRYDPVRLVGAQTACVTALDCEHTALLGPTLDLIAFDKSDACAAGGTIVYGETCRPFADALVEYNRARNVRSLFVGDDIRAETTATATQTFDFAMADVVLADLPVPLLGAFQINNATIAAALVTLWLRREHPARANRIADAIRRGLAATRWPGRLETIAADPLTVIDVGHTPDAIGRALDGLHAAYGADHWLLVLGVSSDKATDAIVGALASAFGVIVCAAARHKGLDAEALAHAARIANPTAEIVIAATLEDAVLQSQRMARDRALRVYVAGGLFLAAEYAHGLRGGAAEDLRFF